MTTTPTGLGTGWFGFSGGDAVIVTGAGNGIGRATALRAAEHGLDVVALDVDASAAESTAAAILAAGGRCQPIACDVTDAGQVEAAIAAITLRAGFLVNNAGPPSTAAVRFDEGVRLGVAGARLVTEAWLASGPGGGAALVNVASVAGNVIGAEPGWYSAAKAAVAGYTRHLAVHHDGRIRANAVAPGMIATQRSLAFADSEPLRRALARVPLHRMGEPDEVAWLILFLLSPLAGYVNGAVVVVDGGWTIAP